MKPIFLTLAKDIFLFFLLFLSFSASSCGNQSEPNDQYVQGAVDEFNQSIEIVPPRTSEPIAPPTDGLLAFHDKSDMSSQTQSGTGYTESSETANKKIIRTAQLNIEVNNFQKAKALLLDIVAKNEAEIEKEEERNYDYRTETNLVIRIAPEKLDDFLVALETLSTMVHFKSIDAKDVTSQFIDLESRLANKKAVVKRYRELLAQASNVNEVLAVEEKLRLLVEEIESTQKNLQYLQGQVQRSVVHVSMFQSLDAASNSRRSFWNQMSHAFGNGWNGFKQFLIGLFSLWPFVILIGLGFWMIRRYRRKKN